MKKKEFIKPTLLDYAILGLIQNQPLSGYAIRKMFAELGTPIDSKIETAIKKRTIAEFEVEELIKKINKLVSMI